MTNSQKRLSQLNRAGRFFSRHTPPTLIRGGEKNVCVGSNHTRFVDRDYPPMDGEVVVMCRMQTSKVIKTIHAEPKPTIGHSMQMVDYSNNLISMQ